MERPRRLQFSTSASHDCSVPDIIQTPDDVFLPNVTAASEEMPQYQEGDSNHLQLPVENQRSRLRRRSLSQNDADSVNVRNSTISELSQLSREHAVHTCSKTPSCSLSSGQSFSTTAPTKNLLPMSADTTASNMQKKVIYNSVWIFYSMHLINILLLLGVQKVDNELHHSAFTWCYFQPSGVCFNKNLDKINSSFSNGCFLRDLTNFCAISKSDRKSNSFKLL